MMTPRRVRAEDPDDFEPPRQNNGQRGVGRIVVSMVVVAAVTGAATIMGLKTVPGGIIVGSAEEVAQLKVRVDDLTISNTALAARLSLNEAMLMRFEAVLDAVTRDRCQQLGRQRAMGLGYDCDGAVAPLPRRP